MELSRTKRAKDIELLGPDLRNMPSLAEYLARLDDAVHDPEEYAHAYNSVVAEISDGDPDGIGCTLFWNNDDPDDAEPRVYGGWIACDDLRDMRDEYARAIHDHHPKPKQYRAELIALLLRRGHHSDNRRVDRRVVFEAVAGMLKQGGRLMLRPDGHLESCPAFPFEAKSNGEADRMLDAGRRYLRVEQRWRSHKTLKRIVSILGERHANGWLVVRGSEA